MSEKLSRRGFLGVCGLSAGAAVDPEKISAVVDTIVDAIKGEDTETKRIHFFSIAESAFNPDEYLPCERRNMVISIQKLNEYFSSYSLRPSEQEAYPFSYLQVMNNFTDSDWEQHDSLRGGGSCNIATLMFRAIRSQCEIFGENLEQIGWEHGYDILSGGLFTVNKVDHSRVPGNSRMPADEIVVAFYSPYSNTDFQLRLNNSLSGRSLPRNLQIKFEFTEQPNGIFTAEVMSNYSTELKGLP